MALSSSHGTYVCFICTVLWLESEIMHFKPHPVAVERLKIVNSLSAQLRNLLIASEFAGTTDACDKLFMCVHRACCCRLTRCRTTSRSGTCQFNTIRRGGHILGAHYNLTIDSATFCDFRQGYRGYSECSRWPPSCSRQRKWSLEQRIRCWRARPQQGCSKSKGHQNEESTPGTAADGLRADAPR